MGPSLLISPRSQRTMQRFLPVLLCVALSWAAKQRQQPAEWDYRSEAEKVSLRGCANLTVVLDNWKFAIVTEIKNLLLYDHQTVLPDYGRIKSLSEALDDLYKEFNALKGRLGELTTRFEGVEAFVDDMNTNRGQTLAKPPPRAAPPEADKPAAASPTKRRRVLVRNNRKPVEQPADGSR